MAVQTHVWHFSCLEVREALESLGYSEEESIWAAAVMLCRATNMPEVADLIVSNHKRTR